MAAQRTLTRRLTLLGLLALGAGTAGCARRERTLVLAGLVQRVVVDMSADVLRESRSLEVASRELAHAPSSLLLEAARTSFKRAMLAWKRASAFRAGPFADSGAFQQAAFWPANPSAIETTLASSQELGSGQIGALGVDARGLYALEYLLFHEASASHLLSATGVRARAYVVGLCGNVAGYAARAARELGDGRSYAARFAQGGQRSVDALVAQALDTLEAGSGKLRRVARAAQDGLPGWRAEEGYFSHSSRDVLAALLEGVRQLYLGGLAELVNQASGPIDEHVRSTFDRAGTATLALPPTLESAFISQRERFDAALAALEELRHVLTVEMKSALEPEANG